MKLISKNKVKQLLLLLFPIILLSICITISVGTGLEYRNRKAYLEENYPIIEPDLEKVNSNNKNLEEVAENLSYEYMLNEKADYSFFPSKSEGFKVNNIKILDESENGFTYGLSYDSCFGVFGEEWVAGNGSIEEENGISIQKSIYRVMSVKKNDDRYEITQVSTIY